MARASKPLRFVVVLVLNSALAAGRYFAHGDHLAGAVRPRDSAITAPPGHPPAIQPRNGVITYFISETLVGSAAASRRQAFKADDPELAGWALGEWQRALKDAVRFRPDTESNASITMYWLPWKPNEHGVTRTRRAGGGFQSTIFVRPDTAHLPPAIAQRAAQDPLYRDVIVYLTCLHEFGHALGLGHSAQPDSVMQARSSQTLFDAIRARVRARGDLRNAAVLSAGDVQDVVRSYTR
jgi:hypothetical protein